MTLDVGIGIEVRVYPKTAFEKVETQVIKNSANAYRQVTAVLGSEAVNNISFSFHLINQG